MLLKAFRLFVSSTFADFASERDVLQGEVPGARCVLHGEGLSVLSHRFAMGVNEEAQLDQRTTEISYGQKLKLYKRR
jgi:hypothetical protein